MLYKFMFNEAEILTIKEALESALSWNESDQLNAKSIDKIQAYIIDEVEAQIKNEPREKTLLDKLRK